jgi:branched-subunit amino acid transport protein
MSIWLLILASGAVVFLARASFIVFTDPARFPPGFRRALAFVPPAVLAAIVLPGLAMPNGALALGLDNPRLYAGLLAMLAAWRWRTPISSIAVGMGALWALQALGR